jgi:hypothetical protein
VSHVFEKYWDYLPCLPNHPDFAKESPFSQEHMTRFVSSLSEMDLKEFAPLVSAEAIEKNVHTVEDAAISRLRPIQDGLDL